MILKAYTIEDKILKMHYTPIFAEDDKHAKKIVLQAVADPDNLLNKAADKYFLNCVGEYNTDTGRIEGYKKPSTICCLADLKGMVTADA